MRQEIARFTATDSTGTPHELVAFQNIIEEVNAIGETYLCNGVKFVETADGQKVRRLAQGEYEILDSQLKLLSPGGP